MTARTSFLSEDELRNVGFGGYGRDVFVSRCARIYNPERIFLGSRVRIDDFCILSGGSGIRVGCCVHVAAFSAIFGGGKVDIDDFAGLSSRVTIYSESDDYSGASLTNPLIPKEFKPLMDRAKVKLGRHVIVGAGATVLPGVVIEEGAAIGAHSLVTRSCEAWTIFSGIPSRKIKARARDLLELEHRYLDMLKGSDERWLAEELERRDDFH